MLTYLNTLCFGALLRLASEHFLTCRVLRLRIQSDQQNLVFLLCKVARFWIHAIKFLLLSWIVGTSYLFFQKKTGQKYPVFLVLST